MKIYSWQKCAQSIYHYSMVKVVNILMLFVLIVTSCTPLTQPFDQSDSPSTINPNPKETQQEVHDYPTFERPEPRISVAIDEQTIAGGKGPVTSQETPLREPKTSVFFIENVGQFDQHARFQTCINGATIYFTKDAVWYTLLQSPSKDQKNDPSTTRIKRSIPEKELKPVKGVNLKINLIGSNPDPDIEPFGRETVSFSYFGGQDKSNWHSSVPIWDGIRYKDIYPGLDLEITSEQNQLTWQFIITDSTIFYKENNPLIQQGIRIKVTGHKLLQIKNKTIDISTDVGELDLPIIQLNGNDALLKINDKGEIIVPIPAQTSTPQNMDELIGYKVKPEFGKVIINSTTSSLLNQDVETGISSAVTENALLLYSTFFGGSDDDYVFEKNIALGNDGMVYIAGATKSTNFPTTPGAFQESNNGGYLDAFVAKMNPEDGTLVYTTYLGGSGIDRAFGLAVDTSGAAYIAGATSPNWSLTFPTTSGVLDNEANNDDGFLTKISPDGSSLIYSTYLGGSSYDWAAGVAVDENGYAYVVGGTHSDDFPKPGNGFDQTLNGNEDVFVTKINITASEMEYFTYIGGSGRDVPNGITLDNYGALYVTGETGSSDFPHGIASSFGGGQDAFVSKVDPTGETLNYSTFLGGSSEDYGYGVSIDQNGNAYVAVEVESLDFPTTTAFGTLTSSDTAVVKLDPMGYSILYSARFNNAVFSSVSVDNSGCAYVVGDTWDPQFPTTVSAFSRNYFGSRDLVVLKLNPSGNQLLYSSFLGGSSLDISSSVQVPIDDYGNIYILAVTYSYDFPTTSNAFDDHFDGEPFVEILGGSNDLAITVMSTDVYTAIPEPSIISEGSADACFNTYSRTQGNIKGPINTRTGGYDYTVSDIAISTSAGSLAFQREYTSHSIANPTLLSPGWTHNHDTRLIFPPNPDGQPDTVLFKAHTANKYLFKINEDGTYSAYPGLCATLEESQDRYILNDSGQKTYTFDSSGKLLSYTDAEGHIWDYVYYTNGKLDRINAEGGAYYLSLQYDTQGRVSRVSDHTGRFVEYNYDTNGNLTSTDDVLGQTWTYEYHPTLEHFLTRIAAPNNVTVERTEYYSDGKAWKQFDGEENLVVELTYNTDGTTTIIDALGNTSTHTYDGRGTLVTQENAAGVEQGKQYDFNFRPETISDGNKNVTNLIWSSDGGNLTKIIDATLGETNITYGTLNNPTSIIDPLNYETKYFYNDQNFPTLPTRIEYPLSFDGGLTYTGTNYEYYPPSSGMSAGMVKLSTDALGNQTFYTYTSFGQTETVTTAYGTPGALTTINGYDTLGRLVDITDEQGIVTHNEYDAAGQLLKTTRNYVPSRPQNDEDKYNLVTEYRYDLRSNQIAVINTYGMITRTYYDLTNRPVTVVQNLTGQIIEATSPPARGSGITDENIRTDTIYDKAGNAIATYDPQNIITRTYYDEANRPKLVIQNWIGINLYGNISIAPAYNPAFPDQNIRVEYFYDLNNNLIATQDTLGVYTRTYFDTLNRPATVVQHLTGQDIWIATPPGRGVSSNIRTDMYYDANGNVIAMTDPSGVITRTYYDAMNRPVTAVQNLTGQTITNSNPPARIGGATDANIRTDTYYDQAGNVIATQDPRGVVTRTYYDESNRAVTTVQNLVGQDIYVATPPAAGNSTENIRTDVAYGQNGRRASTTNPLGQITKYEYDPLGQMVKSTKNYAAGLPQNDQNKFNLVTSYTYDALGRQESMIDTLGRVEMKNYDMVSRLLVSTHNYLPGQPQNYQNEYNIVTNFTYDLAGNRLAASDPNGHTTTSGYDALNRPISVTDANLNATTTSYDANGNTLSVTDGLQDTTYFTYNNLNQQVQVRDPLNNETHYLYNSNGSLALMTDAKGIVTRYQYDNLGRLTAVTENFQASIPADSETNVRTEYTYDANDNRLSILDGNGHLTSFTYDVLNRLATESDALTHTWIYEYDALGNRVSMTDANHATTSYTYDEANRLTGISYPDSSVQFTYDAAGRRLSMTDAVGTTQWVYNALDQATDITDPFDQTVQYAYDPAGNKTALTYPAGQTVSYTYDPGNRLTTVNNGQSLAASYQYDGANRLSILTRANNVNTAYDYDDAGNLLSIVHALNGIQLVASYQYTYDPMGNRTQVIEDIKQPTLVPATSTKTAAPTTTPTPTQTLTPTPVTPTAIGGLEQPKQPGNLAFLSVPLSGWLDLFQAPQAFSLQNQRQDIPTETPTPTPTATWTPVAVDTSTLEAVNTAVHGAQGHDSFVVNSSGDGDDSNLKDKACDDGSGTCTLRAAIEQANANPGRDTITFDLPGADSFAIQPLLALPVIDDPLVIDGTTQPGYMGDPLVVLDGSLAGENSDGLVIKAGGSTVSGLVINRFGFSGIHLVSASGIVIQSNYIGTDASGTQALGNRIGILVEGANGNHIGGTADEERNIISGNQTGIYFNGKNAKGNQVEGNYIGTDASGSQTLINDVGVRIEEASGNSIGGQGHAHNLIIGNAQNIYLHGNGASDNDVQADALNPQQPSPLPTLILEGQNKHKNSTAIDDLQPVSQRNLNPQLLSDFSVLAPVSFHYTKVNPIPQAVGTIFVVTSIGDAGDKKTSDGVCSTTQGLCTLRAAIQQANASAGQDTINFSIPGSGPYIIQPATPLPTITGSVVINGATQPGFAGTPIIQLNGASAGAGAYGLAISAGSSTVRGLVIYSFHGAGISLSTNGGNHIEGNYIGTDVTGTQDRGNFVQGIYVYASTNNVIGGTTTATRNLISGNDSDGVYLYGAGTSGNLIQGNYIGTNADGTTALGNYGGIYIHSAHGNTVGGTATGARNLISSNSTNGILIYGAGTTNNTVQGNYIGTNASGASVLGNIYDGILVNTVSGTGTNTIGGTTAAARNIISGNLESGISLYHNTSTLLVQGNYVGTDVTGSLDLGNNIDGITISDSCSSTIGGTTAGAGNLISGNNRYGIYFYGLGANVNVVQGNSIGTDAAGTHDLGNTLSGITIAYGANNTIGGSTTAARNLISGNDEAGIVIVYADAFGNLVQNNLIGTDVTGTLPLGNSYRGIHLQDAANNTLVTNVIAASGSHGIRIAGTATGNTIQGNFIGTDLGGTLALGNAEHGIAIAGSNNTIGGTDAGTHNTIANNALDGISVDGGTGNVLEGNILRANGGLGIDLDPEGVTANDSGDTDSGPNNLQNFPSLTSVTGGTTTTVNGSFNSAANTNYRLEFFSNSVCDPSDNGEGQTYLGFTNVITDDSGNASFNTTLAAGTTNDQFVSATATDPNGNTSEFSGCVTVGQQPPTATFTPSPTPTATATFTPTYTPTFTPTYTPTFTPTYTPTFTPTPTPVPSGPLTIDYVYDPLNRLTEANYSTGDFYHYSYDEVGNRLMQDSNIGGQQSVVIYEYDDANRLTNVGGVDYSFDANGNLLSDGQNTYAYDSANRLASVNGTESFTYNGLGDRLTQNGVNYTLDLNTGLPQVLSDGTNTYTYGIGRISQSGTETEYFLGDALGSVRQLTSQSGTVTYAAAYNPYGVVTQSDGVGQSAYGFTGEMQSGDLVYLRARYVNVSDGRFLSRDTWEGDVNNPMSFNHWNYTDSNPVNRIDPSGHCWASDGSWKFKEPWFGNCAQSSTSTSTPSPTPSGPTATPSSTPSPTCTYIPTPTGAPMQLAMSYLLKYSPLGGNLYNQAIAKGVKFVYNTEKCQGYRKGNTIGINPCGTPTYDAGTIAHEMYHFIKNSPKGHGSQLEEYVAMLVGDVVRSDLISNGIGTSADMRNFISDYTVNTDNPNQTQLEQDLKAWFKNYEPSYNNLRALPPTPTPTSTQTPTP